MIVAPRQDSLRLVTQGDHAHLAAEILSLFRLPELAEHPRRDRLLRAVREHDNGWREIDAAPPLDPASGRPHDYRSLPDAARRELWNRGARRLADDDPYVCLLIVRHALELHRALRRQPDWERWLAEIEALAEELGEAVDASAEEVASDYRWLAVADRLSLALAEAEPETFEAGRFEARVDDDVLRLAPFPLAGRTTLRLSSRRVPDRAYADERELGLTLARARWERIAVSVAPLG